jgi:hypothetical protein
VLPLVRRIRAARVNAMLCNKNVAQRVRMSYPDLLDFDWAFYPSNEKRGETLSSFLGISG